MKPLPSNNFTDSNGDVWFCTETSDKDQWRNIRTGKTTWRTRNQIISANVEWNEPKLYEKQTLTTD